MKKMNKPSIRFKGFTDPWEQCKLNELVRYYSSNLTASDAQEDGLYDLYDANNLIGKTNSNSIKAKYITVIKDGAGVGRIRILPQNTSFIGTMGALLPENSNIDFDFALLSRYSLSSGYSGSTIPHIYFKDYGNNVYFVPKINEQEEIGKLFKQIDNLITLHQRKHDKLLKIKSSLLEKMFPKNKETAPRVRFKGFTDPWEQRKFGNCFIEHREKTVIENEDKLLSCAITGIYLNSEYFSHQRGQSNIGYIKVSYGDMILSAQNLHLGNANVNLTFKSGIISPAYKAFSMNNVEPEFAQTWVKKDQTKNYFLSVTTEGASVCRKNVVWEWLNQKDFLVPNILEQKQLGKLFQNLNNLITLHQRKLEKLKNIKKSLLEKMFI